MAAELAAAGIAAGATLAGTAANIGIGANLDSKNRDLQREMNRKNEELMREAWARDDTARQRLVKDLEAAGLSKWLAAGASPMSSSPVSLSPVQYKNDYDVGFGNAADKALHAYQTALYGEQTRQQTLNLQEQNNLLKEQIRQQKADADVAEHDRDVYKNRGDIASNDPGTMKIVREVINQLENPNSTLRNTKLARMIFGSNSSTDFSDTDDPAGLRNILGDDAWNAILEEVAADEAAKEQRRQEAEKKKQEREQKKQEKKEARAKQKQEKAAAVEKATVQPRTATATQIKRKILNKILSPFGN